MGLARYDINNHRSLTFFLNLLCFRTVSAESVTVGRLSEEYPIYVGLLVDVGVRGRRSKSLYCCELLS